MLFFLTNFVISELCQGALSYDTSQQICCAKSDLPKDIWLCKKNQICMYNGKCQTLGSYFTNYYAPIVYTAWFASILLQLIGMGYLSYCLKGGMLEYICGDFFFFILQLVLNFLFFTFALIIIFSLKMTKLYIILAVALVIFYFLAFTLMRCKYGDRSIREDVEPLREVFEQSVNKFQGDSSSKKHWRSVVQMEPMPYDVIFNLCIKIVVRENGCDEQKEKVNKMCITKKNLFYWLSNFGIPHLAYILGMYIPFAFYADNVKDNVVWKGTIIQEVSSEDNDPLYPFKTSCDGNYVLEDFVNLPFSRDTQTSYLLQGNQLQEMDSSDTEEPISF